MASSLRIALPRAGFQFHSQQLQVLLHRQHPSLFRRAASTSTPSTPPPKPRVLEQPDKFRPPSHPARLRPKPRYTGPSLSEHELLLQSKRQYPHMMPPEGTWSHWLLTERRIHLVITIGVLISLVCGIWMQGFLSSTPYRELLPPYSLFFEHPVRYVQRWIHVVEMHVIYTSGATAAKRKVMADDILKRSEYRKAHGIEQAQKGFGSWTVHDDPEGRRLVPNEVLRNPRPEKKIDDASPVAPVAAEPEATSPTTAPPPQETYVDFDGAIQPVRKKWFGLF